MTPIDPTLDPARPAERPQHASVDTFVAFGREHESAVLRVKVNTPSHLIVMLEREAEPETRISLRLTRIQTEGFATWLATKLEDEVRRHDA